MFFVKLFVLKWKCLSQHSSFMFDNKLAIALFASTTAFIAITYLYSSLRNTCTKRERADFGGKCDEINKILITQKSYSNINKAHKITQTNYSRKTKAGNFSFWGEWTVFLRFLLWFGNLSEWDSFFGRRERGRGGGMEMERGFLQPPFPARLLLLELTFSIDRDFEFLLSYLFKWISRPLFCVHSQKMSWCGANESVDWNLRYALFALHNL